MAFYTENDEFYNGNTLEQDPLYFIHGHLIHTFRPGLRVSASAGYDYGGERRINGIDKDDTNQDVALAFSLTCPVNRNTGFKLTCIGSRKQESTGIDSDTLMAAPSVSG